MNKDFKEQNEAYIPQQQGMYDPALDKDSCGVGFIADIKGRKSRLIVDKGLEIMCNLEHRGAEGADPLTGDGAGIMLQVPDAFFRRVLEPIKIILPEYGSYAVGMTFLPQDSDLRTALENIIEKVVVDEDQIFLGWRDVPVNEEVVGEVASHTLPFIRQFFVQANKEIKNSQAFERKLFVIRRIIDRRVRNEYKLDRSKYYIPSFSSKTIVYKGMLIGWQVAKFYLDLNAPDMASALALTHTRFSTNTFPTWDLAHPYRIIAHNGEINTLRGNINWMKAREMVMDSPVFDDDIKRLLPIIMEGQSDTATFDTVVELLHLAGRSLPHAIMMMIPEAWSKNKEMDGKRKAFYQYHATFMEPWDGPAAIAFTNGDVIGATLDRNGLRPARYVITEDDHVILASEAGVLNIEPENIRLQGRLQPGKMFLIDLVEGRMIDDKEIKNQVSSNQPYNKWIKENMIRLSDLPDPKSVHQPDHETILERQRVFGYTTEDVLFGIKPMASSGMEALGSMGVDSALAVLSEKPVPLFRYFKQLFAQVTNPPIDPIREELVMELTTYVGPEGNLLVEAPEHAHRLELEHPVVTNEEFEKIKAIAEGHFKAITIPILFDPAKKHSMRNRMDQICIEAAEAIKTGHNMIILSDRGIGEGKAPIPSLLAISGLHHYLIRNGLRTKTGIVLESGEPREIPHFALLCGYGANAINPYLAFETIADLYRDGSLEGVESVEYATKNYIKSIGKGLFKVFSKMGISTLQSYCGAQIFEAIGLDSELIEKYFTGTISRIEGMSIEMLEKESVKRYHMAYDLTYFHGGLEPGGVHYFRQHGEAHLYSPMSIHKLQTSVFNNDYATYKEFANFIDNQSKRKITLRSLLDFKFTVKPIPLEEVEPISEILKRFQTGAMSFGSISWEAHTNLAIAMNRIGGKSNTGEGGEDQIRYKIQKNGDNMRSAIKQVASGRFGVTANYLVNADDIQIKMAQGAKPGEGGQLPGYKVDKYIAEMRFSAPGVGLISPPPHHDIYSIEDLKQLIFDLKNVNPKARISVKLVSEVGVGTIAAGVAKGFSDHILISGHDGGTGASPVSSIHYAGSPWELGLAEAHQTLVVNGLRDRVYLAVDGKMLTGRDVVIAALLGAEEFGFSTSALITQGCVMMRKCHLNTCPVGIATQDEELRKKFIGKPEYLINYMMFIAEETRELMAKLGFRTIDEMVGKVEKLSYNQDHTHWKARGLDFTRILAKPKTAFKTDLYRTRDQNHALKEQIDNEIITKVKPALTKKEKVTLEMKVTNMNRTVGGMLAGEIARHFGEEGLPEDTIEINFSGSAGQSFGAFLNRGVKFTLTGQSNDYVGKGLSGGKLIIKVPEKVKFNPVENIIVGNVCFYGATSGEGYINGIAGERFCVRNSGAIVVVESIGDHGCEYMTGGKVVVLGSTGRNFAAGMSGGIAYVWDQDGSFKENVNPEMVDLESLTDEKEINYIFGLIENHFKYTGSKRAHLIMNDWEEQIQFFVKIMPREYKAALARMKGEKFGIEVGV